MASQTNGTPERIPVGRLSLARLPRLMVVVVLCLPVAIGLAGTVLPAFGILPALGGGTPTFAHFCSLAAEPHLWRSVLASFSSSLLSAFIALAVVGAFVASFAGTRFFTRIQHLVSPLLAVPHAATAFALAFLIAPSGFLMRLAAPLTGFERPPDWLVPNDPLGLSMIAALVAKEIPFLLLVTLAALPQLPLAAGRQTMDGVGYGRIAGFTIALWPQLYRRIRLPVLAVLVYATSVVDVAMILGPRLPPTLPVRITEWLANEDLSLRFLASAAAMLQLTTSFAAIAVWTFLERTGGLLLHRFTLSGHRFAHDGPLRLAAGGALLLSTAVVLTGLALLGLWSVAGLWPFPDALPSSLTARTWRQGMAGLGAPLASTITIALLSATTALTMTILLLRKAEATRYLTALVYLPLLVPDIAFVFGLQVFAAAAGLSPSIPTIAAVHLVFVLPYVFLSLAPAWRNLDSRYEQIAYGLGKRPLAVLFAIRLPMLFRPCLTAFAVGFAVSVSLYLPTLLIGAGRVSTITTEAVALAAGGDRRVIGVYALLQAILPLAGFLVASLLPQLLFRHRLAMRI